MTVLVVRVNVFPRPKEQATRSPCRNHVAVFRGKFPQAAIQRRALVAAFAQLYAVQVGLIVQWKAESNKVATNLFDCD